MKKIGITGGIGSGKTTVSELFRVMGVSVFFADATARVLQETDPYIHSGLIELFGKSIYLPDGKLDRLKMAGLIFNDSELKAKVSRIIHPVVHENFRNWAANHVHEDYVLYEAAILFETSYYKEFDYTILVTADQETRISRVIKRDKAIRQLVLDRIRNQMSDEEKIPLADFIIENNDQQLIIPQVLNLDKIFRNGKIW